MTEKTPSFFHGISFQLAKLITLLVLVLSIVMGSFQLYADYRSHQQDLTKFIDQVVKVTTPLAERALSTENEELANEVGNELLQYLFIYDVEIADLESHVLSKVSLRREPTATHWLTEKISVPSQEFRVALMNPRNGEEVVGSMRFKVDMDYWFADFYSRGAANFINGCLRNIILAVILITIFFYKLTKPITRLAHEINNINPDRPGVSRLTRLSADRNDELAQLVNSSNHLLDVIELSFNKRRATELSLRKSEEHLRQLIDSLPVMIGARNLAGYYLFANQSLADNLGYTPAQMRNLHARQLLKNAVFDIDSMLQNDQRVIRENKALGVIEESFIAADGRQLFLQTYMMPLAFYDEKSVLIVSVDITERKHAQARMEFMAHHDSLTGLPNRLQLVERMEHELRRAQRHGYFGAVLFIDLDQFKNINDSLGHPVGDRVLQEIAKRLQESVRDEDVVARLSGDEFVVVLTVLDQYMEVAAMRAAEVSEKIRTLVSQPCMYDSVELRVTCSVGVVVYPDKQTSVHEILRYADTAMYHVKEKGRDAIEFFNDEMADRVSRQLVMESDLHRAFDEEQFTLHYQPKIDVMTGIVVGAEALLRWNHPTKGTVSPIEFIPLLETSGMIIDIGQWVLEEACKTLRYLHSRGLWRSDLRLSINISPRQFRRTGFVDDVVSALHKYNIPPNSLDMEITEGIVIQKVDDAIATMTKLSQHGVSFSLDDFGTGYSSISYLKRLPVSNLKIDKGFIRDIIDDRNDRVLVETIITMGCLLGLNLVAEGVEQDNQLKILQKFGCHYYQGFLSSPAVPLEQFEGILLADAISRGLR